MTAVERVWRCEGCGAWSHAARRPRGHRRRGEQCGPFVEWHATRDANVDVTALPPRRTFRQSLLAGFEVCPRRTRYGLTIDSDLSVGYTGSSADLGTVLHAVFAEILRTLYRTGETRMPTQEAIEIAYEALAASHVVLPAEERESLRILTLRFADLEWNTQRILALEQPLSVEIVCQDGKPRTLTGRPDLLIADPPDGIVIVDYKTGFAPPKNPKRTPEPGEVVSGKQYLSDRGHYQLDTYGLLALTRYPAASRAILRELHLRSGEVREAVLGRDELEHVQRELAVQMQLIEEGISEGPGSAIWRPRSGHHCLHQCPVARSCPIPVEQRGDGAIADEADADRQAAVFAVVDAQRQQLRDGLKAFHEATGHAPQVGDGKVMRWREKPSGKGRDFGMFDPETQAERDARSAADEAVVAQMEAELERRTAVA